MSEQPLPTPNSANRQPLSEEQLEAALSSLADHDVTEHTEIYEGLLTALQHQLNSSERPR